MAPCHFLEDVVKAEPASQDQRAGWHSNVGEPCLPQPFWEKRGARCLSHDACISRRQNQTAPCALQSHASYSRCGLGSEGTDRLVALVRAEQAAALAAGKQPALYGAKITGGGSGGKRLLSGSSVPFNLKSRSETGGPNTE